MLGCKPTFKNVVVVFFFWGGGGETHLSMVLSPGYWPDEINNHVVHPTNKAQHHINMPSNDFALCEKTGR